ncbi:MAG: PEP-utilizing enzyme [Candidatus Magasanikbacteria bacterium]
MNKDYIFMQRKEGIHLIPHAYIIAQSYCKKMHESLGISFGPTLVQYIDGVMYWYASQTYVRKVAQHSLALVIKRRNFLDFAIKTYDQKMEKLSAHAAFLYKTDVHKKNNHELWKLFSRHITLYTDAYAWSEPVVIGLEESLGTYLKQYLAENFYDKERASFIFSVLTASKEKSFAKEEEDDLFRIAIEIKKKRLKNIDAAITKHEQAYSWVPYDYGLDLWDKKYFSVILDRLLKQDEMERRLFESKNYFKSLEKRQKEIEQTYKIEEKYSILFGSLRRAVYLQDHKKKLFTIVHYHMARMLSEIALRVHTSTDLMQYYLPEELERALLQQNFTEESELKKRRQNSLFIFKDDAVKMLVGNKAKSYVSRHVKKEQQREATLLGTTASPGLYRGTVHIIRDSKEIKNMKKGEVLVATMTSPEYITAMRMAGAIITDQGGIMCHAAIISRELGIPCIVGTKFATTFLKDGDNVEINADQNTVTVIKS